MSKKILAIDDEINICNVIRKYFSERGHTVFTSCEAGEGLYLLNTERPDVLILDIKMPGLNGIDTLRLAKEVKKEVVVIILSAIKEESIMKEALRLGAASYITKPFNLEDLEKAVLK